MTDEQWGELREALERIISRELDYDVVVPEDGRLGSDPVRVARGHCSGPFSKDGITVILEPVQGWYLG